MDERIKKMIQNTDIDLYDCPIDVQLSGINTMFHEAYEEKIIQAVQQIGININKEGLIKALNHDRKRYLEAYEKGFADGTRNLTALLDVAKEIPKISKELNELAEKINDIGVIDA